MPFDPKVPIRGIQIQPPTKTAIPQSRGGGFGSEMSSAFMRQVEQAQKSALARQLQEMDDAARMERMRAEYGEKDGLAMALENRIGGSARGIKDPQALARAMVRYDPTIAARLSGHATQAQTAGNQLAQAGEFGRLDRGARGLQGFPEQTPQFQEESRMRGAQHDTELQRGAERLAAARLGRANASFAEARVPHAARMAQDAADKGGGESLYWQSRGATADAEAGEAPGRYRAQREGLERLAGKRGASEELTREKITTEQIEQGIEKSKAIIEDSKAALVVAMQDETLAGARELLQAEIAQEEEKLRRYKAEATRAEHLQNTEQGRAEHLVALAKSRARGGAADADRKEDEAYIVDQTGVARIVKEKAGARKAVTSADEAGVDLDVAQRSADSIVDRKVSEADKAEFDAREAASDLKLKDKTLPYRVEVEEHKASKARAAKKEAWAKADAEALISGSRVEKHKLMTESAEIRRDLDAAELDLFQDTKGFKSAKLEEQAATAAELRKMRALERAFMESTDDEQREMVHQELIRERAKTQRAQTQAAQAGWDLEQAREFDPQLNQGKLDLLQAKITGETLDHAYADLRHRKLQQDIFVAYKEHMLKAGQETAKAQYDIAYRAASLERLSIANLTNAAKLTHLRKMWPAQEGKAELVLKNLVDAQKNPNKRQLASLAGGVYMSMMQGKQDPQEYRASLKLLTAIGGDALGLTPMYDETEWGKPKITGWVPTGPGGAANLFGSPIAGQQLAP